MAPDEPSPVIDAGAEPAPPPAPEPAPGRGTASGAVLVLAVLALCLATAAPVLDQLWQIFLARLDLANETPTYDYVWLLLNALTEIKVQLAVLGIVAAVAATAFGRRTTVLVALVTVVVNLGAIVQSIDAVPSAQPGARGPTFRVMTFNIDAFNAARDETISAIRAASADIVVLQEAVGDWPKALEALRRDYRYVEPKDVAASQGIMIFSRFPILQIKQYEPISIYYPYLAATVKVQAATVTVIAFHPPRPLRGGESAGRVLTFDSVAQHVRHIEGPVIVAGDLTATPWSRPFVDFVHATGLIKAWSLKPWQSSWPSWLPNIGIPIDHILVNDRLAIADVVLGQDTGSDHFPVIATLTLRAN